MIRIQDFSTFNAVREAGMAKLVPSRPRVGVGMGTCGAGNGAEGVYHAFKEAIEGGGRDIKLASVGCFGFCAQEPLVNVRLPGKPLVILQPATFPAFSTTWRPARSPRIWRCARWKPGTT